MNLTEFEIAALAYQMGVQFLEEEQVDRLKRMTHAKSLGYKLRRDGRLYSVCKLDQEERCVGRRERDG